MQNRLVLASTSVTILLITVTIGVIYLAEIFGISLQTVQAETSEILIPYNAHLTEQTGTTPIQGRYDLSFTLYTTETDGNALWNEEHPGILVDDGAVNLMLGSRSALHTTILGEGGGWLSVALRGPGDAEFTTMEPRQRLAGATTPAGSSTSPPCAHDHVGESWTIANTYGLRLTSTDGIGVYGKSTNSVGVYGASVNDWSGRFDNGIAVTDSNWHGIEISDAAWAGIWVKNAGYAGVEANGVKGDGVWGITQDVDGVGKAGVHGYATDGFHYGLLGQDGSGNDSGYGLRTRGYPEFDDASGDARIGEDLYVDGSCIGCTTAYIAKNIADERMFPGDIVTIAGVGDITPGLTGQHPLLLVQAGSATTSDAAGLFGVIVEGAPPKADSGITDDATTRDIIPSGGYAVVATPGQLVRMTATSSAGGIARGDALTIDAASGRAAKAQLITASGAEAIASGPVLGRALESQPGDDDKIWVLLTFR